MAAPTLVDLGGGTYLQTHTSGTAYGMGWMVAFPSDLQVGDLACVVYGLEGQPPASGPYYYQNCYPLSNLGGWQRSQQFYVVGSAYLQGILAYRWVDENWADNYVCPIQVASNASASGGYFGMGRWAITFVIRGASHVEIAGATVTTDATYMATVPAHTPTGGTQDYLFVGGTVGYRGSASYSVTTTPTTQGYDSAVYLQSARDYAWVAAAEKTALAATSVVEGRWTGTADTCRSASFSVAAWAADSITGTVRDSADTLGARVVRLVDRSTGQVISETTSDAADGSYTLLGRQGNTDVHAVFLTDDTAESPEQYNDLIYRCTPG